MGCSSESPPTIPKYHLMEKCHRSKLGIAAKARYTSLISCQRLGIEKKALSLNFSPPEVEETMKEPLEYTCEVLKCAEAAGGLSLTNDTRFDYYSLYAKPLPNVNSTCVPATGMFYLFTKKYNYTVGQHTCKNISGVLADVTSEQRTEALAQLLSGTKVDAALMVVLKIFSFTCDTLDCTTYRAWAPGHPRRYYDKFDCVVITRHKTWQSTSCKKQYPILCELVPSGPYKRGSIFASRTISNNTNFANGTNDSHTD
ncbi:C-type lectin 6 [Aphomia sociella]